MKIFIIFIVAISIFFTSTCFAYNHVEKEKHFSIGNIEWIVYQAKVYEILEKIEKLERETEDDSD